MLDTYLANARAKAGTASNQSNISMLVQVAVEDIIADGRLRLAVTPVFDETQLAAALQVSSPSL